MSSIPVSLSFFKRFEVYQDIHELDVQFEIMFFNFKEKCAKERNATALNCSLNDIGIGYPSWEIEKKILLWFVTECPNLGVSMRSSDILDKKVQEEMYLTDTEVKFAGAQGVFKSLCVRGLFDTSDGAAYTLSKKGLIFAKVIKSVYSVEKENSKTDDKTRYRDFFLRSSRRKVSHFYLVNLSAIFSVLVVLLFLGLQVWDLSALSFPLFSYQVLTAIKWFFVGIGFLPFIFLFLSYLLLLPSILGRYWLIVMRNT